MAMAMAPHKEDTPEIAFTNIFSFRAEQRERKLIKTKQIELNDEGDRDMEMEFIEVTKKHHETSSGIRFIFDR